MSFSLGDREEWYFESWGVFGTTGFLRLSNLWVGSWVHGLKSGGGAEGLVPVLAGLIWPWVVGAVRSR